MHSSRTASILLAATIAAQLFFVSAQAQRTQGNVPATTAEALKKEAEDRIGVSSHEIVIGSCLPLTGQQRSHGEHVQSAAQAYVSYINSKGGVHGRKIRLVSCDDSYSSDKALQCFDTCLKDKAFVGAFFVGSVPTTRYVQVGEANKMPLLGFCTGNPAVGQLHAMQFNLRQTYRDEVERLVAALWEKGVRRFALLYKLDSSGMTARESVSEELKKHGATLLIERSVLRTANDVDSALMQVKEAKPQVVIVDLAHDALIEALKKHHQDGWTVPFATVSNAVDFMPEIPKESEGVLVTDAVPRLDEQLAAVKLYKRLLQEYAPSEKISSKGFEAFLNAVVLVEALKRCDQDLTRTKFVKALESIHGLDIGAGSAYKVTFSRDNHIGWPPKSVSLSIVHHGQPFAMSPKDWNMLK
jgi:branched-chain amino acid transport system substrate-binding protein